MTNAGGCCLLAITVLFTSDLVLASSQLVLPRDVTDAVDGHLSVAKMRADARAAQSRVRAVEISGTPTLEFTSSGRFPIDSELGSAKTRVSESDETFLDGIFTVRVPLFDFGKRDASRASENFRFKAISEKIYGLRQKLAGDLIKHAAEYLQYVSDRGLVTGSIDRLREGIRVERRRYQGGTGSLTDLRSLEIRLVEMESELARQEFQIAMLVDRVDRDFSLSLEEFAESVRSYIKQVEIPVEAYNPTESSEVASLGNQRMALVSSRLKAERQNLPEVNGLVTTTLYDMDVALGEQYEIVGGLQASMPLFDGGAKNNEIEILEAQIRSIDFEIQKRIEDLTFEDESVFKDIKIFDQQIKDAEIILREQENRATDIQKQFAALAGSHIDVIQQVIVVSRQQRKLSSMYWEQRTLILDLMARREMYQLDNADGKSRQ